MVFVFVRSKNYRRSRDFSSEFYFVRKLTLDIREMQIS